MFEKVPKSFVEKYIYDNQDLQKYKKNSRALNGVTIETLFVDK